MPDPASNARDFRDHPAKERDKTWFTDEADKLRQEAERLPLARRRSRTTRVSARLARSRRRARRRRGRRRGRRPSRSTPSCGCLEGAIHAQRARAKSPVETLADQSPETLALLARDRLTDAVKASSADITRWQAEVASSVEDRVFDELEVFVRDLEPSLRESGRRATLGALGIVRKKSPFIRSPEADEARRLGDLETTRRFELFEERLIQPVLAPFKKGMSRARGSRRAS